MIMLILFLNIVNSLQEVSVGSQKVNQYYLDMSVETEMKFLCPQHTALMIGNRDGFTAKAYFTNGSIIGDITPENRVVYFGESIDETNAGYVLITKTSSENDYKIYVNVFHGDPQTFPQVVLSTSPYGHWNLFNQNQDQYNMIATNYTLSSGYNNVCLWMAQLYPDFKYRALAGIYAPRVYWTENGKEKDSFITTGQYSEIWGENYLVHWDSNYYYRDEYHGRYYAFLMMYPKEITPIPDEYQAVYDNDYNIAFITGGNSRIIQKDEHFPKKEENAPVLREAHAICSVDFASSSTIRLGGRYHSFVAISEIIVSLDKENVFSFVEDPIPNSFAVARYTRIKNDYITMKHNSGSQKFRSFLGFYPAYSNPSIFKSAAGSYTYRKDDLQKFAFFHASPLKRKFTVSTSTPGAIKQLYIDPTGIIEYAIDNTESEFSSDTCLGFVVNAEYDGFESVTIKVENDPSETRTEDDFRDIDFMLHSTDNVFYDLVYKEHKILQFSDCLQNNEVSKVDTVVIRLEQMKAYYIQPEQGYTFTVQTNGKNAGLFTQEKPVFITMQDGSETTEHSYIIAQKPEKTSVFNNKMMSSSFLCPNSIVTTQPSAYIVIKHSSLSVAANSTFTNGERKQVAAVMIDQPYRCLFQTFGSTAINRVRYPKATVVAFQGMQSLNCIYGSFDGSDCRVSIRVKVDVEDDYRMIPFSCVIKNTNHHFPENEKPEAFFNHEDDDLFTEEEQPEDSSSEEISSSNNEEGGEGGEDDKESQKIINVNQMGDYSVDMSIYGKVVIKCNKFSICVFHDLSKFKVDVIFNGKRIATIDNKSPLPFIDFGSFEGILEAIPVSQNILSSENELKFSVVSNSKRCTDMWIITNTSEFLSLNTVIDSATKIEKNSKYCVWMPFENEAKFKYMWQYRDTGDLEIYVPDNDGGWKSEALGEKTQNIAGYQIVGTIEGHKSIFYDIDTGSGKGQYMLQLWSENGIKGTQSISHKFTRNDRRITVGENVINPDDYKPIEPKEESNTIMYVIIAIVVVVVIVIGIIIACCCCKKKRKTMFSTDQQSV